MTGPLTGLRVLDVSTVLAGPLTCQILGDYGADVIKVEHPRGDSMRGHGRSKDGVALWWKMISRNKRCVALYLGDPEGAEVFRRLVATADVVVESFRPGTFERWGLGYDALREINPRLVLVRISGFGQTGPYRARAGFGTLAEAMSGFAAITGEPDGPPTLPPFGLADSIAGMTAANAALMALYHRDARGGAGQEIDVSILEPLVTVLGPQPTIYDQLGEIPERTGNRSVNNAPRNTYRTADDKWVAVSTSANSVAERVMRLIGHPELIDEPWFQTGSGRVQHVEMLDEIVSRWVGARTRDEVIDAFSEAGAAIGPVYDVAELMADPQIVARDAITEVDDPDLGSVRMQNLLFRMSETPGAIRFTGRALGADTDAILGEELGLDVAGLRERGIVA
ncbi:MAG TPA: CoA transferase [Solirubrobacteraceae bacterium]|jgi:crotonobetainyl-CoA:carnitine CoA-transferase CaiB-like acyl-CoA transferase|nr:CoA transferase [Solirubrobacteraceae bacterium]